MTSSSISQKPTLTSTNTSSVTTAPQPPPLMTAVTSASKEQQAATTVTTISSAQSFPSTIFQHFPGIGGSLGLSNISTATPTGNQQSKGSSNGNALQSGHTGVPATTSSSLSAAAADAPSSTTSSSSSSSGLESRSYWFQSLMAQQHPKQPPPMPGTEPNECNNGPHASSVMHKLHNGRTMVSAGEPDDISKSLSFLLAQQLGQQQQQQQQPLPPHALHGGGGAHAVKQSGSNSVGLFAGPPACYNAAALTDMLEIGYDTNGSRRVISMPNPLGNLSFEIPINPPVHPDHSSVIGITQPPYSLMAQQQPLPPPTSSSSSSFSLARCCSLDDVDKFLALQNPSVNGTTGGVCMQTTTPPLPPPHSDAAAAALGIAAGHAEKRVAAKRRKTRRQRSATPSGAMSRSGKSSPDITGCALDLPPPMPYYFPASAAQHSQSGCASGGTAATAAAAAGNSQKGADGGDTATSAANSNSSRMGTPLLLGSATTPGTPSTPSGSAAAMSTLLPPHRVDRQMAASGARPLLFVRPQPKEAAAARRRKRRCVSAKCVSSTASAPASDSFCESGPPLPLLTPGAAASDDAMSSFSSNFEQNTLQWQRISEQRRRDAMRENFDLLKRMLPQSYMDSDDGRELARPVLLARFLRWVDDTLIEMEGLKAEVAQLRSQMHLITTASSNAAATSSSSTIWQSSTTQQPSASSSVLAYYHPVSF
ncbi:hypothetical protein IWW48_003761 [Coemansia sp. RSA 1200]|nr:hypothetical protein IWW48_003761 [Coemansia sp. RSA 1200]